jgi:hypothetical protein
MDSVLANQLALLWRRILRRDPQALFAPHNGRLLRRHDGDDLAQPGFVGRHYTAGGLVFVSMNPGGGERAGRGPGDRVLYQALRTLRDSTGEGILPAFESLIDLLEKGMPNGRIFCNFVRPVLEYAGVRFSDVAYLNLLKWRTQSSRGLKELYEISWRDHVMEQVSLLEPRLVVAIGVSAGKAWSCHYGGSTHLETIPRVVGSNIGNEGRRALSGIRAWLATHPMSRAHEAG